MCVYIKEKHMWKTLIMRTPLWSLSEEKLSLSKCCCCQPPLYLSDESVNPLQLFLKPRWSFFRVELMAMSAIIVNECSSGFKVSHQLGSDDVQGCQSCILPNLVSSSCPYNATRKPLIFQPTIILHFGTNILQFGRWWMDVLHLQLPKPS